MGRVAIGRFGVHLHPPVARRAGFDPEQGLVELGHACSSPRTSANVSSRHATIVASSGASTLSRSSGSVLLERRLTHQRFPRTSSPSSQETLPRSAYAAATFSIVACWSSTRELISPEATYRSVSYTHLRAHETDSYL